MVWYSYMEANFQKNFVPTRDQEVMDLIKEAQQATSSLINPSQLPNVLISQRVASEITPKEFTEHHHILVTKLNADFLLKGKYRTLPELVEKFPFLNEYTDDDMKLLFKDINATLEKRDLPPYEVKFIKQHIYDPIFIAACNVLMNPYDKRSIAAQLKDVGITPAKWAAFLKVKRNREYYDKLVNNMMDNELWNESRVALAKNIADRDLSSIKYFHELSGRHRPNAPFDPQVLMYFMSTVLDVVTKYVDGTVARQIADELEQKSIQELTKGVINI